MFYIVTQTAAYIIWLLHNLIFLVNIITELKTKSAYAVNLITRNPIMALQ